MHGEADARESGRLEWMLNDDDDDESLVIELGHLSNARGRRFPK